MDDTKAETQKEYFVSLSDDQAINLLIPVVGEEEARKMVQDWRHFAQDFFHYDGHIAWRVKAGYSLRQHASMLGPSYANFDYLKTWDSKDLTSDRLVFWVPRIVSASIRNTANEQLHHLEKLRKKYDLPADHLTNFGSIALNSGLILSHFNQTKERVPLDQLWIRTSSRDFGGYRFCLGFFNEQCLYFHTGRYSWDDVRDDGLGCFALGVVKLAVIL